MDVVLHDPRAKPIVHAEEPEHLPIGARGVVPKVFGRDDVNPLGSELPEETLDLTGVSGHRAIRDVASERSRARASRRDLLRGLELHGRVEVLDRLVAGYT